MGFFLQAVLLLIDAGQKIGHFCVRAPIVITGVWTVYKKFACN